MNTWQILIYFTVRQWVQSAFVIQAGRDCNSLKTWCHLHHWPLDAATTVLFSYSSSLNTTWEGNEWWPVSPACGSKRFPQVHSVTRISNPHFILLWPPWNRASRLIVTVQESWGFSWFRGMCQSLGGSRLSSHTGLNFFCSATLFLSLLCKASCNTDRWHIKWLISFSRYLFVFFRAFRDPG